MDMKRSAGTVGLILAASFLGGCAAEDIPGDVSVRDSAGIRILEYADLSRVARRAAEASPAIDLGAQGGDSSQEFYRVTGGDFLSDGSFAVVNSGSHEVRRFGSAGEYVGSYGSEGEGPGEFRRPTSVRVGRADSLFVYDAGLRRVTVLSAELRFGRAVTFQGEHRNLELGGVFGDHGLFVVDNGYADAAPASGYQQFQGRYFATDASGAATDTIGRYPWYRLQVVESDGDMRGVRMFFNEPSTSALSGDLVWVGTRDRSEVETRDRTGALLRLVRWSVGDRTVRQQDIDRWKRARLAEVSPEQRERIEAQLDQASFADVYPTHGHILAGAEGTVWVEEYRRPTDEGPAVWWVFDRDGILVSAVELPDESTPLAVDSDRVLVVERDEFDVELVRVYGLAGVGQG